MFFCHVSSTTNIFTLRVLDVFSQRLREYEVIQPSNHNPSKAVRCFLTKIEGVRCNASKSMHTTYSYNLNLLSL